MLRGLFCLHYSMLEASYGMLYQLRMWILRTDVLSYA